MVMLRPFRPLRYNPAVVGDLSAVVAPPYDVISDAHRDALHERSPYNVIRLILNRAPDRYAAAAAALQAWRRDGVVRRDGDPALGYYVESFTLPDGGPREREGVIGVMRIEPFASGHVRPHERTFARHKEDRMRILRACRTNLSPIFGLFADREHAFDAARAVAAARPADIDLRDDAGVRHRLWSLTEPNVIDTITGMLSAETVFIADGHHRYETALAYRDALRAQGATDPEAPHNFIMMYLTSMSHPGLVILPTHRVLGRLASVDRSAVLERLRSQFQLTSFPQSARSTFLARLREAPRRGRFGVALAGSDELVVATLEDVTGLDRLAADRAPAVRHLDVTVLDAVILRGMLQIDCTAAAQEGWLTYTHDDDAALAAVSQGAAAAFLMNAPRIDDVQAVCLAGETMPEKSTYFYPKLLTGLLFHPLEDEPRLSAGPGSQATALP